MTKLSPLNDHVFFEYAANHIWNADRLPESDGDIQVKHHPLDPELVILDYGREAQFKKPNEWTAAERICRGLIINVKTGECVARPFDKFWNWGEVPLNPNAHPVEVTEKLDGSLGILYRRHGDVFVSTRGAFYSEQALWATDWLHNNIKASLLSAIPDELTLLFEIIYPENRIVVDYRGYDGLSLIGARDRFTGEDYVLGQSTFWGRYPVIERMPFQPAIQFPWRMSEDILAARERLTENEEGFVVRMSDGSRHKLKGDAYLRLHRFVSDFSFKRVLEACKAGEVDAMWSVCPENYRERLDGWVSHIEAEVDRMNSDIIKAYVECVGRIPLEVQHGKTDEAGNLIDPEGNAKLWRKLYAEQVLAGWPEYKHHLFNMSNQRYNRRDLYDDVKEPSDV